MATDFGSATVDRDTSKAGLSFDADTITLSGRFSDEIAAYRARAIWKEVFNSYFLLDKERDYEMKVEHHGHHYVLVCLFSSACGRYAFWRMINGQAPDAENKLYAPNMVSEKCTKFLLGAAWKSGTNVPYTLSPNNRQERRRKSFFRALLGVLQRPFG